jgi:hypothetical protein
MTISIRGRSNMKSVTRFTIRLPRKASPFVSQPELLELMKKDRSEIERELRQLRCLMHHPHRGLIIPQNVLRDWTGFLSWVDGAIQYLEQPTAVPELENLIRTWQDRRKLIVAPSLRWHRRADVIAL